MAAVAIGLFLLSICVMAVVFIFLPDTSTLPSNDDSYRFSKSNTKLPNIRTWHHVQGFPADLAQMETVFWEPDDTTSLRAWLREGERLKGADVLEIGCGTGLVAIECALGGAQSVVASDINPAAVLNATYNAELCGVSNRLKIRQVNDAHPGPFEVIGPEEHFDFIISNPPWEDGSIDSIAAHAFYDPGFRLMDAILSQAQTRLRPTGSLLLAYGAKKAIERVKSTAPAHGWTVTVHDDRNLDSLPEVFLPGMLLELKQTSSTSNPDESISNESISNASSPNATISSETNEAQPKMRSPINMKSGMLKR